MTEQTVPQEYAWIVPGVRMALKDDAWHGRGISCVLTAKNEPFWDMGSNEWLVSTEPDFGILMWCSELLPAPATPPTDTDLRAALAAAEAERDTLRQAMAEVRGVLAEQGEAFSELEKLSKSEGVSSLPWSHECGNSPIGESGDHEGWGIIYNAEKRKAYNNYIVCHMNGDADSAEGDLIVGTVNKLPALLALLRRVQALTEVKDGL